MLNRPGSPAFSPHPKALGYPKRAGSPFVTDVNGRLVTTRVLTDWGEANIHELPLQPGQGRPRVYCPFCGLQGKYRVPRMGSNAFTAHFAHDDGNDNCVEGALESIRHRLAKAALLIGLRYLRVTRRPLQGRVECLRCRKPFVRELLGAGTWTDEREEVNTANARRPDVLALAGVRGLFLFEVHVSNRVDAAKSAVFAAGDVAGLELDAAVLLDEENQTRWTGQDPLGLPLMAWHLDRSPRSFSICRTCRGDAKEFQALAGLVGHLRRSSPEQGMDFLHQIATRLAVSTITLQNSDPETLWHLVGEPEMLREKWGAEIAETMARKERRPSAHRLLLDGLKLDEDPWVDTPLVKLLANPYEALTRTSLKRKVIPKEALDAADLLARVQGLPLVAERLAAYAGFTLVRRLSDGHTASTVSTLTRSLFQATGVSTSEIARWIQHAARKGSVLATASAEIPAEGVALASVASLEAQVDRDLRLRLRRSKVSSDASTLPSLSPEQCTAVESALDFKVSVITGGPGTGKTFVIKNILEASCRKDSRASWILAAPTNKAVQRLREVTGLKNPRDARTIQAWLARKMELQEAPPYGLIVDEAGFLNLEQMAELLDAARKICRLVLVGDPDQLPSIGFGAVLRDIKSSGRVPHIELTQVRRAEIGRGLVEAAGAILTGRVPEDAAGVRLVTPAQEDAVVNTAFREFTRLVDECGGRVEDVQALAPTRKLVDQLNTLIQTRYNGQRAKAPCAPHLRIGDRVVCNETIHAAGLINGIQGVVTAATANGLTLQFEGAENLLLVRKEDAHVLAPAYVMTVHKAQGSEWPNVLIVLDRCSRFIDRSLLYTAATRAKRTLVLVATRWQLEHAVGNVRRRETQLADYMAQKRRD